MTTKKELQKKTYYIELWDVGGSVGSASSVKSTRAVFYNSVNGKAFYFYHILVVSDHLIWNAGLSLRKI